MTVLLGLYGRKEERPGRSPCGGFNALAAVPYRELPELIFPYKQYEAEVIIGVLEGFITCETIGFEDYPCEMTMVRWQAQDWTTEVVLTKRSC